MESVATRDTGIHFDHARKEPWAEYTSNLDAYWRKMKRILVLFGHSYVVMTDGGLLNSYIPAPVHSAVVYTDSKAGGGDHIAYLQNSFQPLVGHFYTP